MGDFMSSVVSRIFAFLFLTPKSDSPSNFVPIQALTKLFGVFSVFEANLPLKTYLIVKLYECSFVTCSRAPRKAWIRRWCLVSSPSLKSNFTKKPFLVSNKCSNVVSASCSKSVENFPQKRYFYGTCKFLK